MVYSILPFHPDYSSCWLCPYHERLISFPWCPSNFGPHEFHSPWTSVDIHWVLTESLWTSTVILWISNGWITTVLNCFLLLLRYSWDIPFFHGQHQNNEIVCNDTASFDVCFCYLCMTYATSFEHDCSGCMCRPSNFSVSRLSGASYCFLPNLAANLHLG